MASTDKKRNVMIVTTRKQQTGGRNIRQDDDIRENTKQKPQSTNMTSALYKEKKGGK